MTDLAQSIVNSPVGPLTVVASHRGVRAVLWPDDEGRVRDVDADPVAPGSPQADVLATAARELEEYFEGDRTDFTVSIDPVGTDFQLAAWAALREIAYGDTISYAEQAEQMGDRKKARAVGAANGCNPISIIVPCHRVVGASGALTGFAGGLDKKQALLELERRVSGHTLL